MLSLTGSASPSSSTLLAKHASQSGSLTSQTPPSESSSTSHSSFSLKPYLTLHDLYVRYAPLSTLTKRTLLSATPPKVMVLPPMTLKDLYMKFSAKGSTQPLPRPLVMILKRPPSQIPQESRATPLNKPATRVAEKANKKRTTDVRLARPKSLAIHKPPRNPSPRSPRPQKPSPPKKPSPQKPSPQMPSAPQTSEPSVRLPWQGMRLASLLEGSPERTLWLARRAARTKAFLIRIDDWDEHSRRAEFEAQIQAGLAI